MFSEVTWLLIAHMLSLRKPKHGCTPCWRLYSTVFTHWLCPSQQVLHSLSFLTLTQTQVSCGYNEHMWIFSVIYHWRFLMDYKNKSVCVRPCAKAKPLQTLILQFTSAGRVGEHQLRTDRSLPPATGLVKIWSEMPVREDLFAIKL